MKHCHLQARFVARLTRYAVVISFIAVLLAVPVHARRLALIVGNDSYENIERLVNARNDANAMDQALREAGFTTTKYLDVRREAFFKAVDSFVLSIKKDDEVVVFYSGHGVQIDSAAYLLPVDIKAESSRQITRDALTLDSLLTDLGKARFALFVIDACRNNPFAIKGQRAIGGDRGLAPIEPPEGTAIIMSAGRGQVALDHLGLTDREPNGLFTREFLKEMRTPGLQVRDLLLIVRDAVEQKAATISHKQRPALVDETKGQFYFYPARPPQEAVRPSAQELSRVDPAAIELAFWSSVQAHDNIEELQAYLQRYPHGQFVELARARIARQTDPSQTKRETTPPFTNAASKDSEATRIRAAALRGEAAAMGRLGFMYERGKDELPRDHEQAIAWYRKGAELNDAESIGGLAAMYAMGRGGVAKNDEQALSLARKGVELGGTRAMNVMGSMYRFGRAGLPKDEAQAVVWFRRAAEGDNSLAMNNLGEMYANGQGGLPKDDVQAVLWYRKAIDGGDPTAMGNLGFMYANGRGGLTKDDLQAVLWYRKAIDGGNALAMNNLGVMYANGRGGLSKDDVQAVLWYRRAIDGGNALAMTNLGFMYENGRGGLTKDDVQAVFLYRKAIDGGNAVAMNNLGVMYETGRGGLTKDDVQAVFWYRKAIDGGNAVAMTNLGFMYENGRGGLTKDDVQAVFWYRKAIDGGNAKAMNNLGVMHQNGRGGLARSKELARYWYQRAADLGYELAGANLANLP